jgi:hypothetical protein
MNRFRSPNRIVLVAACVWTLASPIAAAQSTPPDRAARTLVKQARSLTKAAEWAEAARVYERAHELVPDAVLLFNAARCHESAGDLATAIERYHRVLALPNLSPDLAARATERLALLSPPKVSELSTDSAVSPSEVPAEPQEPVAAPSPPSTLWIVGWSSFGAGLALCAVGGGLLGAAEAAYDDGRESRTYGGAREAQERGDELGVAGWVTLGIGAAALIGGVTALALDSTDDHVSGGAASFKGPWVGPVGGGDALGWLVGGTFGF